MPARLPGRLRQAGTFRLKAASAKEDQEERLARQHFAANRELACTRLGAPRRARGLEIANTGGVLPGWNGRARKPPAPPAEDAAKK